MLTYKHPKAKACAVCDRVFVPDRMGQVVCRPACAQKKARADRMEMVKAERADTKRRKEALKTIADLIREAQTVFNAFIRERDKDKGCFVCGRPFRDVPGQVQHAGHVRSRGAAGHLRFHEDNCMGECEGCNGPHGAKLHQIKEGAIARIGFERWEALENDNTPHKWTREELIEIKERYRAKLKALRDSEKHG